MKRLLIFCLLVAMAVSLGMPVAAGEPVQIDVVAKVEGGIIGEYTAKVQGGKASVTADGAAVTAAQAPQGAVELVVVPVPAYEKDAYKWFADRLAAVGVPFAGYDVYFRDAEGNRMAANNVTVTVAVPDGAEEVKACTVNTGGTVSELSVTVSGGAVSMTVNGSGYCVFAVPEVDNHIRVEVAEFAAEDIPSDLADAGIDTVEKVQQNLTVSIQVVDEDFTEETTQLYEAELMYSEDGGLTWQSADEEHFPEDGRLLVSLPIPEGTDPALHDYTVVHMFSCDAFGKRAGDVEYPEVTKRTDAKGNHYIDFYVTGLSPVMVGWTDIPAEHVYTNKASDMKAADATCTEAARYFLQCDVCGEVSKTETVAVGKPLGHAYDQGTVIKAATCKAEGEKRFVCANDATHSYTEVIPKLKHSYKDGVCTMCGGQWNPQTGDTAPWQIAALFAVMTVSLTVSVCLFRRIRKKHS